MKLFCIEHNVESVSLYIHPEAIECMTKSEPNVNNVNPSVNNDVSIFGSVVTNIPDNVRY